MRNLLVLLMLVGLCSCLSVVAVNDTVSFLDEDNIFNISLDSNNELIKYIRIPLYLYDPILNIQINYFIINGVEQDQEIENGSIILIGTLLAGMNVNNSYDENEVTSFLIHAGSGHQDICNMYIYENTTNIKGNNMFWSYRYKRDGNADVDCLANVNISCNDGSDWINFDSNNPPLSENGDILWRNITIPLTCLEEDKVQIRTDLLTIRGGSCIDVYIGYYEGKLISNSSESPENLTIRIGDNLEENISSLISGTEYQLGYNNINSILNNGCSCINCILNNNLCTFPVVFENKNNSILSINETGFSSNFFNVFNCSDGNITLDFKIYNENSVNTLLDSSLEMTLKYWYVSEFNNRNINVSLNGSSHYKLCIDPANASLNADAYINYKTDNGFTHRYYFYNNSLSINSLNLSLYNFDTQTGISNLLITVRNSYSYNYMENVIGKLQRYYTGEGVWRTVQMDKTGDYGQLFFNILEENTDYRFVFSDTDNNVLKTTNSMKFVCDSGTCSITYLLVPYTVSSNGDDFVVVSYYDNATSIVSVVWEDVSGDNRDIIISVDQERAITNNICSYGVTSSGGTYNCDITGYTGVISVVVKSKSGDLYLVDHTNFIDIQGQKLFNVLGDIEGAFWSSIIAITLMGFGLMISPSAVILALLASFIAIFSFGLLSFLSMTVLIIISVLSLAVMWIVER